MFNSSYSGAGNGAFVSGEDDKPMLLPSQAAEGVVEEPATTWRLEDDAEAGLAESGLEATAGGRRKAAPPSRASLGRIPDADFGRCLGRLRAANGR